MSTKLNLTEQVILQYIRRESHTQSQLSVVTGIERTKVYRQLVSLEYKGYVRINRKVYPQKWEYALGATYGNRS